MNQTATEDRATKKEWLGLAVLVVPILVVSMDMSVLYLALPFMTADLEPTSNQTLWILDIYGFLLAGLLITMGSLGDRIGRRTLLMVGAVVFGAASLAATFSTSPEMLLVARALLGVGGATIAPSTLSLIRNMFHNPAQRRKRSACGQPVSQAAQQWARLSEAFCWNTSGGVRSS